jgi:hypothetical protein
MLLQEVAHAAGDMRPVASDAQLARLDPDGAVLARAGDAADAVRHAEDGHVLAFGEGDAGRQGGQPAFNPFAIRF